jgi:hypothetical protein
MLRLDGVPEIVTPQRPAEEQHARRPACQQTKANYRDRFTINRKTADTLGIVIPQHLYILADEVIE